MKILKYEKIEARFIPWNEDYFHVANALIDFIRTDIFDVLHIGSTSAMVGGKGIIDLSILYERDQLDLAVKHLKSLGFQDQISNNPFPNERPRKDGAVIFNEKKYLIHVHVIRKGSIEYRKQLKYKDFMLSNPKAREKYEESKKLILEQGILDQEEYGKQKSPFVKAVLEKIE
ncbi:hypothetical protein CP965_01175 [Halarcobacter mediterraneus]|uniref:GrpB family protein n=1 Tax=Halarcobacter mediterraneus TaxID=2023153 RepID=A0A4Q1B688_9BACT|nr:GrpB family protein [Halarcobacter mediterraneus]RXK14089.1 hypothetical protein CP965_01175 [Halarcobacter mediterraneus]